MPQYAGNVQDPPVDSAELTEDTPFARIRGLSIDTEGTVALVWESGAVTTPFLVAGVIHPLAGVVQINSSGTSASGFWGYY